MLKALVPGFALSVPLVLAGGPTLAAAGGWTAVQRSQTAGQDLEQRSQVAYGHHRLRVDNPGQRLIVEFETGALVYVDLVRRQYARVTLEEMVELRERQMKELKSKLSEVPPQIRDQLEAQLAEATAAAKRSPTPKATKERRRVAGVSCVVHTWSGPDGKGRACLASKLPFNHRPFEKDSAQLAGKMAKLGAGSAAASMAMLQLGGFGFPVEIEQTLRVGGGSMEVRTVFEELAASDLPLSHFQPPAEFEARGFEALMKETVAAGGPGPSRP